MFAIDFITNFSVNRIAEPNTSLAELLDQLERSNTTLALTNSRRAMVNQVNSEALAETIATTRQHPRLLPTGTLDPRHYIGWRDELRTCVEDGCAAIRFSPGLQNWSPDSLIFEEMVEAISSTDLPIIVDFRGPFGGQAREWIRKVAVVAHQYQTPVVFTEVNYHFAGELLTVMHRYPEVHATIRYLGLGHTLELFASEGLVSRLLYGSNAPKFSITALKNYVLLAELSDADKQAILAGNALRLLKLDVDHLPVPLLEFGPAVLPDRPIIDIHAHTGGYAQPVPHNGALQTSVPDLATRSNVELTLVSHHSAFNYDMAEGNAWTQQVLDQYSTLRGYVVCDPRDLAGSVEQMERYFADPRFVGVKLYCPFGGNMATVRMQAMLDHVARFGRPTKIHMDEGSSPYPGLRQACLRNPDLVVIKAHGDDAEGAQQVADLPNVYFEFCSSQISPHVIRRSMDILGPERILFGSDSALFNPAMQYGAYAEAFRNEREAELVLRENPRRIFRLGI